MTDSPDTTRNAWDWTVTVLTMFGKSFTLVPPCSHLPTYKHKSNLDKYEEELLAKRQAHAANVNLARRGKGATSAQHRANNHIWHEYNKEVKDE